MTCRQGAVSVVFSENGFALILTTYNTNRVIAVRRTAYRTAILARQAKISFYSLVVQSPMRCTARAARDCSADGCLLACAARLLRIT